MLSVSGSIALAIRRSRLRLGWPCAPTSVSKAVRSRLLMRAAGKPVRRSLRARSHFSIDGLACGRQDGMVEREFGRADVAEAARAERDLVMAAVGHLLGEVAAGDVGHRLAEAFDRNIADRVLAREIVAAGQYRAVAIDDQIARDRGVAADPDRGEREFVEQAAVFHAA